MVDLSILEDKLDLTKTSKLGKPSRTIYQFLSSYINNIT